MSTPTQNPILEMRNISKAFAGVQALKDVSFACQRGAVHALVGENGAGKSTLMKILAGAYQPDSGEIVFNGQHYSQLTTREAQANGIAIIHQELNLLPYMTVAENIFLGRELKTSLGLVDRRGMNQQAEELLKRVGVHMDVRRPVGELTVARQQMVEIAKALSQEVNLIVMDEPSAILAGHELEMLFQIIESLVKQNVTVVYISHRLDEVFQIAARVTVMKDGRVVGTKEIGDLSRPELVQMMVGRSMDEVFPKAVSGRGKPVLVAQNLSNEHVHNVSFTLHAGEILGVAGMVGSGRTELARAIFGADPVQSGTLLLEGEQVRFKNPVAAVRQGIALVPEDRKTQGLFMELPIRNNLTLTILDRISRAFTLQSGLENQAVEKARGDMSIAMASPSLEVQYLSGGNQQKVVLAKWLATEPKVVILDEPTRGIDVGAKFEIYQLMRRLTERGVAILMISSELPEVLGMSDRIVVMHDGALVGEFSRDEATEEKIIQLATTGRSLGDAAERTA
jgi:ribose transport system ATP-binding protein